jgi:hypothetical protein
MGRGSCAVVYYERPRGRWIARLAVAECGFPLERGSAVWGLACRHTNLANQSPDLKHSSTVTVDASANMSRTWPLVVFCFVVVIC